MVTATDRQLVIYEAQISGALSETMRYTKALQDQARATVAAGTAMSGMNARAQSMGASLQKARPMLQQVGFQISDLIIVSQMGANAIGQMGIQFGQMASILPGLGGVIAGVAFTLGGVLIQNLGLAESSMGRLKEAMQEFAVEAQNAEDQYYMFMRGIESSAQYTILKEMEATMAEINSLQERMNTLMSDPEGYLVVGSMVQELQDQLEEQQKIYNELKAQYEYKVKLSDAQDAQNAAAARQLEIEGLINAKFVERIGLAIQAAERAQSLQANAILAADALDRLLLDRATGGGPDQARSDVANGRIRIPYYTPPAVTGGGGGGGGMSRMAEDTRRAAEEMDRFMESYSEFLDERKAQSFFGQWAKGMDGIFTNSLDRMIDGLVDGQFAFKQFAQSVMADLAKMTIKAIALYQIQRLLGISFGDFGSAAPAGGIISNVLGFGGKTEKFARGGVVNGPTMFPMRGGVGLAGEAGPEAIMPLRRDSSGNLGVGAAPITIVNNAGVQVDTSRYLSDGEIILQAVKAVETRYAKSMVTGQGTFARTLELGFNARRRTA